MKLITYVGLISVLLAGCGGSGEAPDSTATASAPQFHSIYLTGNSAENLDVAIDLVHTVDDFEERYAESATQFVYLDETSIDLLDPDRLIQLYQYDTSIVGVNIPTSRMVEIFKYDPGRPDLKPLSKGIYITAVYKDVDPGTKNPSYITDYFLDVSGVQKTLENRAYAL